MMRDAKQYMGLLFLVSFFFVHDADQEEGREVKGIFSHSSAYVSA